MNRLLKVRHKQRLRKIQIQEKAKLLGNPKFIQLAVATKEVRGGRGGRGGLEGKTKLDEASSNLCRTVEPVIMVEVSSTKEDHGGKTHGTNSGATSGLRLIMEEQRREREAQVCSAQNFDPLTDLENSKLFGMQGEAGFSFSKRGADHNKVLIPRASRLTTEGPREEERGV